MDLYEDGGLKDQKLNMKQITSAPEFKQHILQPLHNLNPTFQKNTLQQVIDKKISLKEAKEAAVKFRVLQTIKTAFMRCTNLKTWSEAEAKYPSYACEARLTKFQTLDFKFNVPEQFRSYCQSAIAAKEKISGIKTMNGQRMASIHGNLKSIAASDIKELDPHYNGARLILCSVPEVSIVYCTCTVYIRMHIVQVCGCV